MHILSYLMVFAYASFLTITIAIVIFLIIKRVKIKVKKDLKREIIKQHYNSNNTLL